MPVMLVSPLFTQKQYEESVRRLTEGKDHLDSPADWPVEGLLSHTAGQGESGFRVGDVWASDEAANRFAEIIVPLLSDLGVEGEPDLYQVHTHVAA
jgi:hypothetical protein